MKIFVAGGMVPAVISDNAKRDAQEVGRQIGENGHTLLHGGRVDGVIGHVHDEFHKYSDDCEVIVPECYKHDLLRFTQYKRSHITKDVSGRLNMIMDCDKIVVLPGGIGTLCELVFACDMNRMDGRSVDILVINSDGYFDGFRDQIQTIREHGYTTNFSIRLLDTLQNKKLNTCTFCNRGKETILMETESFYVVADRYATKDGHLCICAKEHCNSAVELTDEQYDELIELKDVCKRVLSEVYGDIYTTKPIAAEHGANAGRKISSRSIDHLHWHVTFVDPKAEADMIKQSEMQKISGRKEQNAIAGKDSYIWYEDSKGQQYMTTKLMPKQFLRGVFAVGESCENDFVWSTATQQTKDVFAENETNTISRVQDSLQNY
jgi:hypothetical protein